LLRLSFDYLKNYFSWRTTIACPESGVNVNVNVVPDTV
jgi:hypothetical protein